MSHPKDISRLLSRCPPALAEALKRIPLGVKTPRGGLAQVTSLPGGSKTRYALSCLGNFFEALTEKPHDPPPPISTKQEIDYFLFASDEGVLYPEALWTQWRIPLARLVNVKLESPEEVWRVALEAVQVGLFRWVVIRPSRACANGALRKLQLSAEHHGVRVLLLAKYKLPHWVCQSTVEVGATHSQDSSIRDVGFFPASRTQWSRKRGAVL